MATPKLARYQAMRDFEQTAEPSGRDEAVAPSPRLRFVIQKHAATRLHYDLRLEHAGVFRSWAVTRGPALDPQVAARLADEPPTRPARFVDLATALCDDGDMSTRLVVQRNDLHRTRWEDVPADWTCPYCGATKADFDMIAISG